MDLFSDQKDQNRLAAEPLPVRMRPKTLEEFVGQEHFLGEGKLLRRTIQSNRMTSAIFYGPPGTGKTTLARLIALSTEAHYEQVNAIAVGVREVRDLLTTARERLELSGQRTLLFIDELHRFNKAQQDVLLRDVEEGIVVLIGATTQNPFFAINAPLVSRSQIFQFESLSNDQITMLMRRALADSEHGLGRYNAAVAPEALEHLATMSDGDARRALTALEIAVLSQAGGVTSDPGGISIDLATAEESIQRKAIAYDATGDGHYDAISALIKSIRGSDPDASVYWLAQMLEAGEDPRFIARRIVIAAAEDIGNADPLALILAESAASASDRVGLPECQLILAQAVTYLASVPKSNAAAKAIWSASEDVRQGRTVPVPKHLRSTGYAGAKKLGAGEGYRYPHDHPDAIVEQEYLGVEKVYYTPSRRGTEAKLRAYLESARRQASDEPENQ